MESSFGVQIIWVLAAQEAIIANFQYIEVEHVFNAILKFAELDEKQLKTLAQIPNISLALVDEKNSLIKILKNRNISVPAVSKPLRRSLRKQMGYGRHLSVGRKKIHRSKETKELFLKAEEYAYKINARNWSTLLLLKVILNNPSPLITRSLGKYGLKAGLSHPEELLADPDSELEKADPCKIVPNPLSPISSLVELIYKLKELRKNLSEKIFGQDHAIQAFIEGLYNSEVTGKADVERKRPLGVFVFAGPPGVGKTYMAELTGSFLQKPFKRFDMTAYSGYNHHELLIGVDPSYRGAQPGILTEFVKKNPEAFLVFDEIEKANLRVIHLFYQILDAGRLEDKYLKQEVDFKNTTIIFTTNAGRVLYDNPNKIGINAVNSGYHRRTVLSALANEKNPSTGKEVFPQAICSRLAQGYPVMFNHLGINELERLCEHCIKTTGILLEKIYKKKFTHNILLPLSLVLKEGGLVDARQLKAECEKFIKTELFKFCSLYEKDSLENNLKDFDEVYYDIEKDMNNMTEEIHSLYESSDKPGVLLITNPRLDKIYNKYVSEINWFSAFSSEEAIDILSTEDINLVLLDLWLGSYITKEQDGEILKTINQGHDFTPLAAKDLDKGRNILRKLHKRFPGVPIYLLSIKDSEKKQEKDLPRDYEKMTTVLTFDMEREGDWEVNQEKNYYRVIDDELFLACVRAGGARGLVATDFADISGGGEWLLRRNQFVTTLLEINRRIYRERQGRKLLKEHKALNFDTVPVLLKEERKLLIKLRNFHLTGTIDAVDTGLVVDDIEKPETKFAHVMGADFAKNALSFVVKWLKKPEYYKGMGVRQPKGILLTGPPGTGKTMLARAIAGEASCAFIETSGTAFVTIWQGSGPQNIRNLFDRARRYAPAIIFIDEIDAIGKKRSGSAGGSARAEEGTLNALLTEMDGFGALSSPPVIVLAATNLADHLDEALRRRFDRIIEVDRPDKKARITYIEEALSGRKISKVSNEIVERIAIQSAGMTIADLERILQEAAIMAVEKNQDLTDEIMEEAFDKIRMGEAKKLPDYEILERISRHEAGHTIVAWLGNNVPLQVTIVGRGKAGGYMERELQEERIIYTKSEMEQRICEAMGGRAAEIIYYGEEEGLSSGVSGDLKNATAIAKLMAGEYGMVKDFGLISFEGRKADGPVSKKLYDTAEKIVQAGLEKAITILKNNKEKLDLLSKELLKKNRLTREELEILLSIDIEQN